MISLFSCTLLLVTYKIGLQKVRYYCNALAAYLSDRELKSCSCFCKCRREECLLFQDAPIVFPHLLHIACEPVSYAISRDMTNRGPSYYIILLLVRHLVNSDSETLISIITVSELSENRYFPFAILHGAHIALLFVDKFSTQCVRLCIYVCLG